MVSRSATGRLRSAHLVFRVFKLKCCLATADNRAGPSNLGNVISQILLCKQITPDFNQEELCSIAKDSQEMAKLLSDMQEYMPQQDTYLGNVLSTGDRIPFAECMFIIPIRGALSARKPSISFTSDRFSAARRSPTSMCRY